MRQGLTLAAALFIGACARIASLDTIDDPAQGRGDDDDDSTSGTSSGKPSSSSGSASSSGQSSASSTGGDGSIGTTTSSTSSASSSSSSGLPSDGPCSTDTDCVGQSTTKCGQNKRCKTSCERPGSAFSCSPGGSGDCCFDAWCNFTGGCENCRTKGQTAAKAPVTNIPFGPSCCSRVETSGICE